MGINGIKLIQNFLKCCNKNSVLETANIYAVKSSENLKYIPVKSSIFESFTNPYATKSIDLGIVKSGIAEGKSLSQIASDIGCKVSQLRTTMKSNGLKTMDSQIIDNISKEELVQCIQIGMSAKEIANKYGIKNAGSLTPRIKKGGLPLPTATKTSSIPDEILLEYKANGFSDKDIAKELNISPQYIAKRLSKFPRTNTKVDLNVELIRKYYEEYGWAQKDIAERMDVSLFTINKIIKQNGLAKKEIKHIERKPMPKAEKPPKYIIDKSEVETMYSIQGLTMKDIAKRLGVPVNKVSKIVRDENLLTPTENIIASLPKGEGLKIIASECTGVSDLAHRLGISKDIALSLTQRNKLKFLPKPEIVVPDLNKIADEINNLLKNNSCLSVDEISRRVCTDYEIVDKVIKSSKIKVQKAYISAGHDSQDMAQSIGGFVKEGDTPVQIGEMLGISSINARKKMTSLYRKMDGIYGPGELEGIMPYDARYKALKNIPPDKKSPTVSEFVEAMKNTNNPKELSEKLGFSLKYCKYLIFENEKYAKEISKLDTEILHNHIFEFDKYLKDGWSRVDGMFSCSKYYLNNWNLRRYYL